MNDIVIKVENLSKRYRIGLKEGQPETLVAAMTSWLKSPLANYRQLRRLSQFGEDGHDAEDILWALKDVSFEVQQGEVVGIIGRNGAGKSTLLKILSRITEPTSGRAVINGRVSSLLEVGTGFHSDLTGRENIYLNGTILGMSKAEVERKFDEIVDFSGVEKFIDTPVKRYSSGMLVRLAFSVAAHLEPEILLVDEVLAVGDAAFQKKCLGKMGDVAQAGRTVLFVSHNMISLQSLCQRAIWINEGQKKMDAEAPQVVSAYLQSNATSLSEQVWDDIKTAPGNETVRLHRVCIRPKDNSSSDHFTIHAPLEIEVEFWTLTPDVCLDITLRLLTDQQIVAFATSSANASTLRSCPLPAGLFRTRCQVPGNLLNSGLHRVTLLAVRDQSSVIYQYDDVLAFEVLDLGERRMGWYGKPLGVVRPQLNWTKEFIESELTSYQEMNNT